MLGPDQPQGYGIWLEAVECLEKVSTFFKRQVQPIPKVAFKRLSFGFHYFNLGQRH